jgi:hypothetical protein
VIATGARLPGVADSGQAGEDPEDRRVFVLAVVVGNLANLGVDGQSLAGVNVPMTDMIMPPDLA